MLMYLFCGLGLFFLSQNPSFAFAAIVSETNELSGRDAISDDEEGSKDEKFKSAVYAFTTPQYLPPRNKGDSFYDFIAIFLKQIAILHYSLRSPPFFSS